MVNSARRSRAARYWLAQILTALLVVTPLAAQQPAAPPPAGQNPPASANPSAPPAPTQTITPMAQLPTVKDLKILALSGNDEMNQLERKIMAPLVVQVLDQNDRPIQGAEVVFRFPLNGPSAAFAGGKPSETVRSNGTGEAAALNWFANNETGAFDVHVTATYGNHVGEATVKMTNVTRIVEGNAANHVSSRVTNKHWYSPTWVKIALIGGAAGAVAGIVLAVHGGGHSTTTTPPITVTPGPPTVGH